MRKLRPVVALCAVLAGIVLLFQSGPALAYGGSEACRRVNAGSLNLNVKVGPNEQIQGLQGSGVVSGFHIGERLSFRLNLEGAAVYGMQVTISLAAFRLDGLGRLSNLFELSDSGVNSGSGQAVTISTLTVTETISSFALFAASSAVGQGSYRLQVACDPAALA